MKVSQLNKYVWLVDLIHNKKRISLKEINRHWVESDISNGEEIPERTFHKWRVTIENLFGLIIENEKRGDFEVLKPLWLRYEIAWKVEAMSRKYNG